MTSNLGSSYIQEYINAKYEDVKKGVMELVTQSFRPEFINRIDEILLFNSLNKEQMYNILAIILQELEHRLLTKDLKLEISDAVKEKIIAHGYDPLYGARPLKRTIIQLLEDPLAQLLVQDIFVPGDHIRADIKGDLIEFGKE